MENICHNSGQYSRVRWTGCLSRLSHVASIVHGKQGLRVAREVGVERTSYAILLCYARRPSHTLIWQVFSEFSDLISWLTFVKYGIDLSASGTHPEWQDNIRSHQAQYQPSRLSGGLHGSLSRMSYKGFRVDVSNGEYKPEVL